MKTFKFKKGVYIVKSDALVDSYKYELYIGKNKNDVKKQYDKRYSENLNENIIQDVTLLRICQVLEKLKYMPKSHYFNLQDTTVLNWLENEFKIILKEDNQKEDNKKEVEDATKSNN